MMQILVAADTSPTTIAVRNFLQKILKPLVNNPPTVTILHVYEPELDYSEEVPLRGDPITPTSEGELRAIFQPIADLCPVHYTITNADLGESILNESAEADLIVIGRHRHSQIYEMVTGSLVQFVLHRADCPVLLVPEAVVP